jgi:hypothetical protein
MDLLSNITYLLLGFLAGYFIQKDKIEDSVSSVKDIINQKWGGPVGVVKRPTAKQLFEKTDPLSIKLKEGKDAMEETLKDIL